MSTASPPAPRVLPPLVEGQRLDRATFHARYEAMPPGTRAELIGGVVCMPSPMGLDHGRVGKWVIFWLASYEIKTPGVEVFDGASVLLDDEAEPQPDATMRIAPGFGGRSRDEGRYLAGAPELIVEVSHATRSEDLGPKLADYERAGVLEYLVVSQYPHEIRWHARRDGRLAAIDAGADGLYRSEAFPGLWLDPEALVLGDLGRLQGVLAQGLADPGHAEFVAGLSRTLDENRAAGRLSGRCACGHPEAAHEPATSQAGPGGPGGKPGRCTQCACRGFLWARAMLRD